MKRPALVTLLAVLHFIGAALLFIGGSSELWEFPFDRGRRELFDTEAAVLALIFGVIAVACGAGLWRLKPYGRRLQIGLAAIWVFLFPVGTVIGGLVLFYMWTPGIRALFSGKQVDVFTSEEHSQIEIVSRPSGRTVLVGLFVLLGLGVMILAFYVTSRPGRIKSTMAGNEAAAIATLRLIVSAQAAHAAGGGGGYATSFARLAMPCAGMKDGFIPSYLGKDPARSSGYIFRMEALGAGEGVIDCHGAPTGTDFYVTAEPMNYDTGKRAFSASAAGVLYEAPELPPSAVDTLGGTATPVK